MGRPPIGMKAMTNAERMRRYRARLRSAATVTEPPPVTEPEPSAVTVRWIDKATRTRLRRRIAKLPAVDELRAMTPAKRAKRIAKLTAEMDELEALLTGQGTKAR
jgi:hypothetical protein